MRISDNMIYSTVISNLDTTQEKINTLDTQLSSGQELSQVSDDPSKAALILGLRTSIAMNAQSQRNVGSASAWLSETDSALGGVNNLLGRAEELAVEGASDNQSAADRQNIATEVNSLIAETVQFGNSTYEGSYIFAGARTDQAPFSATTGGVIYNNADPTSATAPLAREIAPGTQVVVNTVGHDPTNGNAVFDQVFSALGGLYQALQSNNTSAIQTGLQSLRTAQDALSLARANVGGVMEQVNATRDQLTLVGTHLAQYQSSLQDVDMARAAADLAQASVVRQATLAATAKTFPPSLFNYLT